MPTALPVEVQIWFERTGLRDEGYLTPPLEYCFPENPLGFKTSQTSQTGGNLDHLLDLEGGGTF